MLNVPKLEAPTIRWKEVITTINNEANRTRLKNSCFIRYRCGPYSYQVQHYSSELEWQLLLIQQRGSEISAYETRASSIPWVFSPDLDLPRNPAWSRMWESFGEDAYLSSQMELQWLQVLKDDVNSKYHVASCMKHFIGYGSTTTGKDRTLVLYPNVF
jgi:beta-glucosidase